jgi:hypothetical protein
MAGNVAPNTVTDSLVLYLDAANTISYPGSGTVWTDLSGAENNASLVNGVSFNTSNNGSLLLDGTNQYVNVTNSTLFANNTNMSVSIWLNFSSLYNNTFSLMSKGQQDFSANRNYWWLNYNYTATVSNRRLTWETGDGAGNLNQLSYTSWTPNLNTWYNVVGTFEPNLSKLYLDGTLVASASTTVAQVAANNPLIPFNIGAYRNVFYFFPGKLNQSLFYKKTLSSSEVLQNYNATKNRYL